MTPLLSLEAAAGHLECKPSDLLLRGAKGDLPVFAGLQHTETVAMPEDIPKPWEEDLFEKFHAQGTDYIHTAGGGWTIILPPPERFDLFRVPAEALGELLSGTESLELSSAVSESHHALSELPPGKQWLLIFSEPHPILTRDSLRFREADLQPKVGSKPDEYAKPRTPLTAFITSELFKGIQDWHKSWDEIWELADGKIWRDIGDFRWKLTRSRKDTTKTENVPAIEMEGDIRWKRTVPKEDFGRIFRRIQKMRTQADSPK
jgi:hypothetical protein